MAAIGASAFFGVRFLMDRFAADDGGVVTAQEGVGGAGEGLLPPEGLSPPAELLGPPFEDELLGIFIGPNLVESPEAIPDTFLKPGEACPPGARSEVISWEQAGELNLDLELPPEYVLQEGSLNTGAFACGDRVTGTIRHYDLRLDGDRSADIFIGRNVFRLADYHVTANRVKTAVFAGREAVVIEPAYRDGRHVSGVFASARSGVFFLEPFGATFISGSGLPTEDLLKLAQIVAEATIR